MPRYLVTLRHAETGETKVESVSADDLDDAIEEATWRANEPDYPGWYEFDHAAPADDEPVPGRDR